MSAQRLQFCNTVVQYEFSELPCARRVTVVDVLVLSCSTPSESSTLQLSSARHSKFEQADNPC